jgi:hypothetical protein
LTIAINKAEKQDLAVALLLLRDFKREGDSEGKAFAQSLYLARKLGLEDDFNEMISKVPPMKITETK